MDHRKPFGRSDATRRRDRRTCIVATLGPATDPPDVLRPMVAAGVDLARINFSRGGGSFRNLPGIFV
jgi:hypothetical protein